MLELIILLKANSINIILAILIICTPILLILAPFVKQDIEDKFSKKLIKKKEAKQKKENLENFDENLIRLEKLGKLYKDGIITKEEFEEKRNKFKL
jgi:hypothetical protein